MNVAVTTTDVLEELIRHGRAGSTISHVAHELQAYPTQVTTLMANLLRAELVAEASYERDGEPVYHAVGWGA